MNKPFLKWAGSKFRVLPQILPLVGKPVRYCEPFGGSLSVALNVEANHYVLADINADLVAIYTNLMSPESDAFLQSCEDLFVQANNCTGRYNELRAKFNTSKDEKERAKLFIYLNRHCFNGLSRYNKAGQFNVPHGKYAAPVCPLAAMKNFKTYFESKHAQFTNSTAFNVGLYKDFTLGDVVYFDPPYVPLSETASFTDYSSGGFSMKQQEQLAKLAESLSDRGVKVIISNHDTEVTRVLYQNARIHELDVTRTIAASGSKRKKAKEILAVFHGGVAKEA